MADFIPGCISESSINFFSTIGIGPFSLLYSSGSQLRWLCPLQGEWYVWLAIFGDIFLLVTIEKQGEFAASHPTMHETTPRNKEVGLKMPVMLLLRCPAV